MEYIFLIAGVMLLALTLLDFAKTTLLPSGQGPVTAFINHYMFNLFFRLAGRSGRHSLLLYAGMSIILAIFLFWVIALWTGVLLIFLSDSYSVLKGSDKLPADVYEKIYYTGFTLSTLGVGDFIAGRDGWRVLTAITAFMGLFTITLSITYLVPVISNAGQKRTLARYMKSLGTSPEDIVINSYNGQDFSGISSQLTSLASMIFSYTQNLLTYPILHHMHNSDASENIVVRMACLDEALNIFLFHIPEKQRPEFQDLYVLRNALTSYLMAVKYLEKEVEAPPPPELHNIGDTSSTMLDNISAEQKKGLYQQLERRRKLWLANLHSDGWKWKDLLEGQREYELDIPTQNLQYHA